MQTTTRHPSHAIHDRLPSGFAYANRLQIEEYETRGWVTGATKHAFVKDRTSRFPGATTLAVRLGPPKRIDDVQSFLGLRDARKSEDPLAYYVAQYNLGWSSARRGGDSRVWQSGSSNEAWDDGYLDGASGRPKWHITHCADHDACGEA